MPFSHICTGQYSAKCLRGNPVHIWVLCAVLTSLIPKLTLSSRTQFCLPNSLTSSIWAPFYWAIAWNYLRFEAIIELSISSFSRINVLSGLMCVIFLKALFNILCPFILAVLSGRVNLVPPTPSFPSSMCFSFFKIDN